MEVIMEDMVITVIMEASMVIMEEVYNIYYLIKILKLMCNCKGNHGGWDGWKHSGHGHWGDAGHGGHKHHDSGAHHGR